MGDHFLHSLGYVETALPRLQAALPSIHLTAVMPASWKAGNVRERKWSSVGFFT